MAIKKYVNTTEAAELTGHPYNEILNLAKTGVLQRKIPFEIKAPEETNKGLEAFWALRAEAQKNGLQDMTLDEINEEIRLAREERRAKTQKK